MERGIRKVGRPFSTGEIADRPMQLKLTPSEWERLESLRGDIPRATYIKRLIASASDSFPTEINPTEPEVPVFGTICAGSGLEVSDWIPGFALRLPTQLSLPPGAYGLLVRGDSMTDPSNAKRSIPDGSIAIFWPSPVMTPGSIVHVEWQDSAGRSYATLKRLTEKKSGEWQLEPLNPKHDKISPGDSSWTVRGVYVTRIEHEPRKDSGR